MYSCHCAILPKNLTFLEGRLFMNELHYVAKQEIDEINIYNLTAFYTQLFCKYTFISEYLQFKFNGNVIHIFM